MLSFTYPNCTVYSCNFTVFAGGTACALTKKLADNFCVFLTDMTHVPEKLFPYFLAPDHRKPFSNMADQKACAHDIV